MKHFDPGDRVQVDIHDTKDSDFERFHGRYGEVVDVVEDTNGQETGDERDQPLFTIEFEDGSTQDFRWQDLRQAPEE